MVSMKKYNNIDLYDLFEADGIEYTLLENIDIDNIEDDDVRELCDDIKESIFELKKLVDNSNSFGIIDDDDDDDEY